MGSKSDIHRKKQLLLKKKALERKRKHSNDEEIDPRFARVKYEATFQKMDKSVNKTKVDGRFKGMFDKKRFGAGQSKVDKYGRKIADFNDDTKEGGDDHFFKEDEEAEVKTKDTEKDKKSKKKKGKKKKVDEPEPFHWSEQSSSEDMDEFEGDLHELLGEKVVEYDFLTDEEEVEMKEISSARLALMNYDWSKIKVGDIFITLSSFLPAGGEILSVKLYQSEFGKKMMKREQEEGPIAIWEDDDKIDDYEDNELNEKLNDIQIRKYELGRLKYYYSIIEFDSKRTADIVFSQCNNIELQNTGIKLDLRAVPDEMEIPGPIVEECTEKPSKASNFNFMTRSRQHTKLEVTWEAPAKGNKNAFLFENDDILDNDQVDLHQIIASEDLDSDDSGEEEEDVEDIRAKLLGKGKFAEDGDEEEDENVFKDFDKANRHKGVEVNFLAAFEDEDSSSSDETDAKKIQFSNKNRTDFIKRTSDDEIETDLRPVDEDEFFQVESEEDEHHPEDEDGTQAKKSKKETKREKFKKKLKAERKARNEAEQERRKRVRDKRNKENDLANLQLLTKRGKSAVSKGEFQVDMDDERFGRFTSDPNMAIDPTIPEYDADKAKPLLDYRKKAKKNKKLKK